MTPATTLSKAYYNEGQYQAAPTAKVETGVSTPKISWMARLETGIAWFSQNLTGQYKQPSVEE